MSELYNHYVDGKKASEITHSVVTDIKRGRIGGLQLRSLISELETNGILDDTIIKTSPKSEWNDTYLELLSYEVVGGTFSKQYLLHLAEVADYTRTSSTTKKRKTLSIGKVVLLIAVLGILTLGTIFVIPLLKG